MLSFALSGLTGLSRLRFSDDYVVKAGHESITQAMIDDKYDTIVRSLRSRGMDLNEQDLAAFGVSKTQILRNLLQESLIRQQVNDMGIDVGEDAIAEKIKNTPDFQINGHFDRQRFNDVISAYKMDEASFTSNLHSEMKNSILLATLQNNIPVNDYIVNKDAAFYGETRDIGVAIIKKDPNITLPPATDKELKDFYFENSYQFQIPETRDITYIKLPKTKENEAELYDITVKIEDELSGGATLKEIADKLKLNLQTKKGLTHDDTASGFSTNFLDGAFTKDPGQNTDLVNDEKNNEYFVIQVDKVNEARIPELAEVKDKAVQMWKASKINDANLKHIDEMVEELKKSKEDLKTFAAKHSFKYEVISDVSRNDTEENGARLVSEAFAANKGDIIGSYQNEDGTYKIAQLKDISESEMPADDKAKFKEQLLKNVQLEIMDQYFEYLKKKYNVKTGEGAQKLANNSAPEKAPLPAEAKTDEKPVKNKIVIPEKK